MPHSGASLELCRKALARQRTWDLSETASALLAKDKQIAALQRECRELQARLSLAGKVRGSPGHTPCSLSLPWATCLACGTWTEMLMRCK